MVAVWERPPNAVNKPAAVGMKQSLCKAARMLRRNILLPRLQLNFPIVFLARAMLREQARPVPRITDDDGTPATNDLHCSDPVIRWYGSYSTGAFSNQTGPGICVGDAQNPDSLGRIAAGAYAAVTQIKAQQVGVGRLRQLRIQTCRYTSMR